MFAAVYSPTGGRELILECARQFTPRFEVTSADTLLLDIAGLDHLFGDPPEIARAIAKRLGVPANIAVSSDADTAVYISRAIEGVTIIPPGKEARSLAALPVKILPLTPETAETFECWGIRNLGQLAALPPLGVAARLGEEGTHLQQLARGEVGRRLRDLIDPVTFEELLELDSPVELLEPLSFLFSRILNELTGRLLTHGLSANEIRLELMLEAAPPHRCTVRLPVPMRDPLIFLKLLQLELNARPPGAAILKIRLGLQPTPPRPQQNGLFVPLAPEPERLEITLSRLSNLLGRENVGTPEVLDTHRPDSYRMNHFAAIATALPNLSGDKPERETPVIRHFRPPKHAQVRMSGESPVHVNSMYIDAKVVRASGPWHTSGEWWLPEPWDHKEWDIELTGGVFYRLYQDCRTERWFLAGAYD